MIDDTFLTDGGDSGDRRTDAAKWADRQYRSNHDPDSANDERVEVTD
ncbi:MAG: hypothetical protein ACI9PP_001920 [Halobacteriales archaeon]|jgi:hypothetical protein